MTSVKSDATLTADNVGRHCHSLQRNVPCHLLWYFLLFYSRTTVLKGWIMRTLHRKRKWTETRAEVELRVISMRAWNAHVVKCSDWQIAWCSPNGLITDERRCNSFVFYTCQKASMHWLPQPQPLFSIQHSVLNQSPCTAYIVPLTSLTRSRMTSVSTLMTILFFLPQQLHAARNT